MEEIPSEFKEEHSEVPSFDREAFTRRAIEDDFGYFSDESIYSSPKKQTSSARDFYAQKDTMAMMGIVSQKQKHASSAKTWSIGLLVKHRRFGEGRIIAVKGSGDDTLLTIAFEKSGIKNLVAMQANLEIVKD